MYLWISVLHTYIFQGYFMGITTYCKTSNTSHTRQYCKTSNISHTLIGNKIVEHSDIVGASPVGAAPTTSSFSTWHLASMDCTKTTARWEEKHLRFGIWCTLYQRFYSNIIIPVPEKWVCMVTLKLTGTKPQQNNNKTQQNTTKCSVYPRSNMIHTHELYQDGSIWIQLISCWQCQASLKLNIISVYVIHFHSTDAANWHKMSIWCCI